MKCQLNSRTKTLKNVQLVETSGGDSCAGIDRFAFAVVVLTVVVSVIGKMVVVALALTRRIVVDTVGTAGVVLPATFVVDDFLIVLICRLAVVGRTVVAGAVLMRRAVVVVVVVVVGVAVGLVVVVVVVVVVVDVVLVLVLVVVLGSVVVEVVGIGLAAEVLITVGDTSHVTCMFCNCDPSRYLAVTQQQTIIHLFVHSLKL